MFVYRAAFYTIKMILLFNSFDEFTFTKNVQKNSNTN